MAQSGMFVCAQRFAVQPCERLFSHFRREEDQSMERGKLEEEFERMAQIARQITPRGMLLCNESFASTNEREGAEIAWQVVSALTQAGARVGVVTHNYELARRLAEGLGDRARSLRAAPEARFRLRPGEPQPTSHAGEVYQRVFGEPLCAIFDDTHRGYNVANGRRSRSQ